MNHVNLLGDDKPSQTDQPPQIPRTVALQTSDTPTAINELRAQVVFPRHEKRNRELNINCVARLGLIHEQLLGAARAKSLYEMEYLHGHLASVTEANNRLASYWHASLRPLRGALRKARLDDANDAIELFVRHA